MEMFNPPHPGEIIREDCLKPLKLSVTEAAKGLGVSRQSLSELLNGRNGISADMALRLEKAGWSTAESWPPQGDEVFDAEASLKRKARPHCQPVFKDHYGRKIGEAIAARREISNRTSPSILIFRSLTGAKAVLRPFRSDLGLEVVAIGLEERGTLSLFEQTRYEALRRGSIERFRVSTRLC